MKGDAYLVLGGIACLFGAQTVALALIPLAAIDVNVTGLEVGVLLAAMLGVGLATDVLVGTLADSIGQRGPMVTGAIVGLISLTLLMSAQGFIGLLVGALGFGLSWSLVLGPANAYLTQASPPEQQATVQGLNGAGQGLGALGGAVLIGVGVEPLGPRGGFIVGVALLAMMTMLFIRVAQDVQPTQKSSLTLRRMAGSYLVALSMVSRRSQFRLSLLVSLVYGACVLVAGNAFLPLYIVTGLGGSLALAGGLLAARNLLATVTSLFFRAVVGRFGLLATILGSNLITAATVLAVPLSAEPGVLLALVALQGIGTGFVVATVITLVSSATAAQERALGFGAQTTGSRVGGLVHALVFGAVFQAWGIQAVFVAAGAATGLYVLLMALHGLPSARSELSG